jgi:subtilisin family serine protease
MNLFLPTKRMAVCLAVASVAAVSFGQGIISGLENPNRPADIVTARGHFIVAFKPTVTPSTAKNFVNRYGLKINDIESSEYFSIIDIPQNMQDAGVTPESLIKQFKSNPGVLYAELDVQIKPDFTPNDPRFNTEWHHHNTGQTGGTNDADLDSPEAWDNIAGLPDVVVAVCDDGVDRTHEDLASVLWVNTNETPGNNIDDDNNGFIDDINGWDFASNDNNPNPVGGSHGTHVAGITGGAWNNGKGVAGCGPNIKIMAMRHYAGQASWMSDLAKSIDYAWKNGADVITVSYNVDGWNSTLLSAIQRAGTADVVYLNSAGNNGQQNPPRQQMRTQADNLIFVAATDDTDSKAGFSNWGSLVEVGAPGVDIMSTLPGNTYGNSSGTSMATPLAAGVVAMIRAKNPNFTARQTLDHLLDTSDQVANLANFITGGKRVNLLNALGQGGGNPTFDQVDVIQGTQTGGDMNSLSTSDDDYFSILSTFINQRGQYAAIEVVANSPVAAADINALDLEIESRATAVGVSQTITVLNYATGKWDTLSSMRLQTTDAVVSAAASSLRVKNYVDANNKIRVRIQALVPMKRRGVAPSAFDYFIDAISLSVR